MRDEDFGLWGAYFWALSAARHTLGHQLVSPTASFGINVGLMAEFAFLPESDPRRDKIRHYADVMFREVERLKMVRDRAVNQLRTHLEPGETRPGLSEVLSDLEWLMKPMATKLEGTWQLQPMAGDIALPGDPIAFHHALFVILMLALLEMSKDGRIVVTAEREGPQARLTIRTSPHNPEAGPAAWFPAAEAAAGPPGTLGIALRAFEQQGVHWDAPTSPGEPIALHWHLEDTETDPNASRTHR